MKQRLEGLCLVLAAVLIAYWSVYQPLRDAAAHLQSVSVSMKGATLFPLVLVFGLGLLIGGPAFAREVENSAATPAWMGKMSAFGWTLVAISVLTGLPLYFWLLYRLHQLGYPI